MDIRQNNKTQQANNRLAKFLSNLTKEWSAEFWSGYYEGLRG